MHEDREDADIYVIGYSAPTTGTAKIPTGLQPVDLRWAKRRKGFVYDP
jgi:hypothetical protein